MSRQDGGVAGTPVRAVAVALSVIETVAELQPVSVGQVSKELGLPKSTVQRALLTLEACGWIRNAGVDTTRWTLTTKPLHVGLTVNRFAVDIRDVARPAMQDLREASGENVHLLVAEDDGMVLIERFESAHPVRLVVPIGTRTATHDSSAGLAWLAALPDEDVHQHVQFDRWPDAAIGDLDVLSKELAKVRDRGFASTLAATGNDIPGVAAAILGRDGRPCAAITVSCPASRLGTDEEKAFGRLVVQAATRIGRELARTI